MSKKLYFILAIVLAVSLAIPCYYSLTRNSSTKELKNVEGYEKAIPNSDSYLENKFSVKNVLLKKGDITVYKGPNGLYYLGPSISNPEDDLKIDIKWVVPLRNLFSIEILYGGKNNIQVYPGSGGLYYVGPSFHSPEEDFKVDLNDWVVPIGRSKTR